MDLVMFYGHIKRKKTGAVWGDERERADSESMKQAWAEAEEEGQPY